MPLSQLHYINKPAEVYWKAKDQQLLMVWFSSLYLGLSTSLCTFFATKILPTKAYDICKQWRSTWTSRLTWPTLSKSENARSCCSSWVIESCKERKVKTSSPSRHRLSDGSLLSISSRPAEMMTANELVQMTVHFYYNMKKPSWVDPVRVAPALPY